MELKKNVLTLEEFKTQFTAYVQDNTTQFFIDDAEAYHWDAYYQGYLDGYSFETILEYATGPLE